MKVKEILLVFLFFGSRIVFAQEIKIPAVISKQHPRFLPGDQKQDFFQKQIAAEEWAAKIYNDTKKNIEEYVNRHQTYSIWMVSN